MIFVIESLRVGLKKLIYLFKTIMNSFILLGNKKLIKEKKRKIKEIKRKSRPKEKEINHQECNLMKLTKHKSRMKDPF